MHVPWVLCQLNLLVECHLQSLGGCLVCANLFQSSGMHGESMWSLDLWELDVSHHFCLCSAKYDWSCHVGHFKYGWECFIVDMQM